LGEARKKKKEKKSKNNRSKEKDVKWDIKKKNEISFY